MINPAIYDICIDRYHSGPGISRSSLMEFMKSPYHYWYKQKNPEIREPVEIIRKTNALEFGNAFHAMILEPEKFKHDYSVMPKVNRATKLGKMEYEKFKKENEHKLIICSESYKELEAMQKAVWSNSDAAGLIPGSLFEQSLYWTDPDSQMLCKVRPDIWQNGFVADLKTCASASPRDFQQAIYKYGYHIQCGMIHEAIFHVTGQRMHDFIFIAVEKEAPYAVAVYKLDEPSLQHGIKQFKDIILNISRCTAENNWPCYPTELISIPSWALS